MQLSLPWVVPYSLILEIFLLNLCLMERSQVRHVYGPGVPQHDLAFTVKRPEEIYQAVCNTCRLSIPEINRWAQRSQWLIRRGRPHTTYESARIAIRKHSKKPNSDQHQVELAKFSQRVLDDLAYELDHPVPFILRRSRTH